MSLSVVFPLFGGRDTELAKIMVRSVKQWMPWCRVIQLSDEKSSPAGDVEMIVRTWKGKFSEWYFGHMESLSVGDFINCEDDTIFKQSVADVFDDPFDIALTVGGNGIMNAGVTFVRNKRFYSDMKRFYELTSKNEWNDMQVARQMTAESGLYAVRRLSSKYNHIPSHPGDVVGAKIVHYKDKRKDWLLGK